MLLKLKIDALESVDEAFRPLYEKDGDAFKLKVEGVEDTSALKGALDKERKARADLEKKVKRWESLGKSDEEIAELLKATEEAERKKAEADGDHQKILKQLQDKWAKEKADLEAELTAARSSERGAIIGTSVMSALTKAGATEEGIDLLPDRLAGRIKYETEDGKRVLKIMQADGETPMAGSGKDGTATFDDLVKEAVAKWPSLFKGANQSGGGKQPDNAGGAGAKKKSDFKSEKDRAAWVEKNGFDAYKALPD
ncbi:hypothetical protein [Pseudorhodoplanes sp.]|uniref:hypothetical protein n=1 Tax=Pseudorhodoplanes sp. TaxID=1934341 RepID=UPI002D183717|nr:hypothetical protein [Pseudorhodoplanes sp.]HWV44121.1 hypothetical protein [Pseudorhodoplanes sp.]